MSNNINSNRKISFLQLVSHLIWVYNLSQSSCLWILQNNTRAHWVTEGAVVLWLPSLSGVGVGVDESSERKKALIWLFFKWMSIDIVISSLTGNLCVETNDSGPDEWGITGSPVRFTVSRSHSVTSQLLIYTATCRPCDLRIECL